MKRAALFLLLSVACSDAESKVRDEDPIEAGPGARPPRGDGGFIGSVDPDAGSDSDGASEPAPVSDAARPEPDAGSGEPPAAGSLRLLTYNVAGLPAVLSSSDPAMNTPFIGPLLKDFDLVHVQEDFNYHAELYANDMHTYRSSTSGGVPLGDGLNTLSYGEFFEFQRVKWQACNGTDCLTPKGFSYARHRLAEGVYVDVYNAHPNASTEEPDLAARRSNISQLAAFIDANSIGNAVLVLGDTNTRYTRAGDNVRELSLRGFTDVWLELVRKGDVPVQGAEALTACQPSYNTPQCEIVDKVFFRSNRMLKFKARSYLVEDTRFVRPDGEQLSDHYPVAVELDYTLASGVRASDLVGGDSGAPFNDLAALPDRAVVTAIALRGGERLDGLSLTYAGKNTVKHGGDGGTESVLMLEAGDGLRRAELCTGDEDGKRVFFAALETEQGKRVEAGTRSADCVVFEAPPSFAITGFYGRAGAEIDRLGVLYTKFP